MQPLKITLGFIPTPSGMEAFKKELSGYKGAKGSVQFPIDQPLPLPLIRRIVEYRVKENLENGNKRRKAVVRRVKKENLDDQEIRGRLDLE